MNGILYTEPNFKLTLDRIKTNTRRIVPKSTLLKLDEFQKTVKYKCGGFFSNTHEADIDLLLKHARYKKGDVVYLKEPYKVLHWDIDGAIMLIRLQYSNISIDVEPADKDLRQWYKNRINEQAKSKSGFCNKMFMPSWIAEHFIEITDVKCERLQSISNGDYFEEGIYSYWGSKNDLPNRVMYKYPDTDPSLLKGWATPQEAYAAEIDAINGKGKWESNPWVYSYYYKLLDKRK